VCEKLFIISSLLKTQRTLSLSLYGGSMYGGFISHLM